MSYGPDLSETYRLVGVYTGKILKGVLQVQRKHVHAQEYVFENKGENEKTVVVDCDLRRAQLHQRLGLARRFGGKIDREPLHTRHRGDRLAHALALDHEHPPLPAAAAEGRGRHQQRLRRAPRRLRQGRSRDGLEPRPHRDIHQHHRGQGFLRHPLLE